MKKIFAIVGLIAMTQASAFWGWNDDSAVGYNNGYADAAGNADAAADFTFDFNMSASMRGAGRGYGDGYGNGYGYNAHIPYYGAPYGYLPPPAAPPPAE